MGGVRGKPKAQTPRQRLGFLAAGAPGPQARGPKGVRSARSPPAQGGAARQPRVHRGPVVVPGYPGPRPEPRARAPGLGPGLGAWARGLGPRPGARAQAPGPRPGTWVRARGPRPGLGDPGPRPSKFPFNCNTKNSKSNNFLIVGETEGAPNWKKCHPKSTFLSMFYVFHCNFIVL